MVYEKSSKEQAAACKLKIAPREQGVPGWIKIFSPSGSGTSRSYILVQIPRRRVRLEIYAKELENVRR
jgi:hypothetical protein